MTIRRDRTSPTTSAGRARTPSPGPTPSRMALDAPSWRSPAAPADRPRLPLSAHGRRRGTSAGGGGAGGSGAVRFARPPGAPASGAGRPGGRHRRHLGRDRHRRRGRDHRRRRRRRGDGAAGGSGSSAGCNSSNNGGATDKGVTANSITVGNITSISGVAPGLTQSAQQATQAWAAYVNSQGGICGRMIKVQTFDDGNDAGQNYAEASQACSSDFAMVGNASGFDDGARPGRRRRAGSPTSPPRSRPTRPATCPPSGARARATPTTGRPGRRCG